MPPHIRLHLTRSGRLTRQQSGRAARAQQRHRTHRHRAARRARCAGPGGEAGDGVLDGHLVCLLEQRRAAGRVVAGTAGSPHSRRRRGHHCAARSASPRPNRTPHDLAVREAGLRLSVGPGDAPVIAAHDSGRSVDPLGPAVAVDAASSTCMVVARTALEAVGGVPLGRDLDIATVELFGRLRRAGGAAVVVPSAPVLDHRPVESLSSLRRPFDLDGDRWRAAVERSGPALYRVARTVPAHRLRFAITVSAPSMKVGRALGRLAPRPGTGRGATPTRPRGTGSDPRPCRRPRCALARRACRAARPRARARDSWTTSGPVGHQPPGIDRDSRVRGSRSGSGGVTPLRRTPRTRTSTPVGVLLQATDHRLFGPVDRILGTSMR